MPWDVSPWNMSNNITAVLTLMQIILSGDLVEGYCLRYWNLYATETTPNKKAVRVLVWKNWIRTKELKLLGFKTQWASVVYLQYIRRVQSTDLSGCMYTKVITGQTNNYYALELCSALKTKDMVNKFSSLNLPKVKLLFWFFHIFACFYSQPPPCACFFCASGTGFGTLQSSLSQFNLSQ